MKNREVTLLGRDARRVGAFIGVPDAIRIVKYNDDFDFHVKIFSPTKIIEISNIIDRTEYLSETRGKNMQYRTTIDLSKLIGAVKKECLRHAGGKQLTVTPIDVRNPAAVRSMVKCKLRELKAAFAPAGVV